MRVIFHYDKGLMTCIYDIFDDMHFACHNFKCLKKYGFTNFQIKWKLIFHNTKQNTYITKQFISYNKGTNFQTKSHSIISLYKTNHVYGFGFPTL